MLMFLTKFSQIALYEGADLAKNNHDDKFAPNIIHINEVHFLHNCRKLMQIRYYKGAGQALQLAQLLILKQSECRNMN